MWAVAVEDGFRFGFSAYAVRLLGEVHHLRWSVEVGTTVAADGQVGFIEGSKATSDLYAPMAGKLTELNRDVLADPTLINTNLYDSGWLFSIAGSRPPSLSPHEYLAHVEASWPLAQRLLKGQMGRNSGE